MDHILNLVTRFPALAGIQDDITKAFDVMRNCFASGGKLLVCGNGGSAADSGHITGELLKGFVRERALPSVDKERLAQAAAGLGGQAETAAAAALQAKLQQGLPAVSLCDMSAPLTAVINDNGAEFMYAQLVYALGKPGDVLFAISTSGGSKNIVYAALAARAFGLKTVALTGKTGGELAKISDAAIIVPEDETYKIQEYHLPVYHALCLALEEHFFIC
jgi:D-sedoheptulose 7-phosphate isomerase